MLSKPHRALGFLFPVLVSALILAGCSRTEPVEEKVKMPVVDGSVRDYWPLKEGNQWVYECSNDGFKTSYKRIDVIEKIDGNKFAYRKKVQLPDTEDKVEHFAITDDATLVLERLESLSRSSAFEPPKTVFLTNRMTGSGVVYETVATMTNTTLEHSFKLISIEPVDSFQSAVKVSSVVRQTGTSRALSEDVWWVKGIGRVRWISSNPVSVRECYLLDSKLQ